MSTKQVQASSMKKGSFIVIDGAACKVVNTQISKPGKHGHAKIRIEAVRLLDEKRREEVVPTSDNVEVPMIEKRNAQVLSISGDKANIMDTETYETFDLEIPEEMKGEVADGQVLLYWVILGQKVMKQVKTGPE